MALYIVCGHHQRPDFVIQPVSTYRSVFWFQRATDNTSRLRYWCNNNCVHFRRRQDCIPHPKQHCMGIDYILSSKPPWTAPGQLATVARQSWIAIFLLDDKYA